MINDTKSEEENTVEETETTTEEVVGTPPSLTVQDLANLRNMIDIASQRGAFKPNEFAVIGATYSKLSNFINAITPTKTEGETAEDTTEDTAEVAGEK